MDTVCNITLNLFHVHKPTYEIDFKTIFGVLDCRSQSKNSKKYRNKKQNKNKTRNKTRMHSSRMRTARCSRHLLEGEGSAQGGGVCPGGVCLPEGCLP